MENLLFLGVPILKHIRVSSPVRMYRKSYCTIPGVSISIGRDGGIGKMFKFCYKMGKVLSGELSFMLTDLVFKGRQL